jgi:hypothetical protein
MDAHKQLIERFYSSFQQLNWQQMIACYHENVFFYDPVFQNLEAPQAKAMWEMLCKNAKDLSLQFSDVKADGEYGSCNWKATYTFSKTGRKVVNNIKAHFTFHEGKIIEHMDDFDLWKWSRQALGTSGVLLGWSPFVQNKIRKMAKANLEKFMREKGV